jgi:D-alanine-D-alanine ligase
MKKNLLVLCGGQSSEHPVSVMSAKNIIKNTDTSLYNVFIVGISYSGCWYLLDNLDEISEISDEPHHNKKRVSLIKSIAQAQLFEIDGDKFYNIDIAFPVMHGNVGEDGAIQGLLRSYNIAFVGSDVIGSSICMDKDIAKRLLLQAGIQVPKFMVFKKSDPISYRAVIDYLGDIIFVKPCNCGSSMGISKASSEKEFLKALELAFSYDEKIMIEEGMAGLELECAVLENQEFYVSSVGSVKSCENLYSYDAKYFDDQKSKIMIPANISVEISKKVKAIALEVFKILACSGMARVDFFLSTDDKIYVNEVNTIPGFTNMSMYPKLLLHDGYAYKEIINNLLESAQKKFHSYQQKKFK